MIDGLWKTYLRIPKSLSVSRREVEDVLTEFAVKGSWAIDIGCGYGRISTFLRERECQVLALDITYEMLLATRKRGVDVVMADAEYLPVASSSINLVVTDGLLEHFRDVGQILSEEKRVSRKYVVNFVPAWNVVNQVLELVQRTPKVFWRSMEEWRTLHMRQFIVDCRTLRRLYAFICRKSDRIGVK